MMLVMDILLIFLLSFLAWAILLGIPYLVAKKVNPRPIHDKQITRDIAPPQAYIHNAILYIVVLFILAGLLLQLQEAEHKYAFKAMTSVLVVAFTYQILRLFRK
jgi:hypothetical protein